MCYLVSILSLILSPTVFDNDAAIFLLATGQLAMLVTVIRERHLTGAGAFLFMSFLFFAVRPIYLVIEKDLLLFQDLFLINPKATDLSVSMWWATAAMLAFQIGILIAKKGHRERWQTRSKSARVAISRLHVVTNQKIAFIIIYQVISLGVMVVMGKAGRSLYDSALGAYIYDFPAMMQAGHIFAMLLILERYRRERSSSFLALMVASGVLFLAFTLEMRNVSMFRGFYLTGVLAGGIAILARLKPNVKALWLMIPIIFVLPLFKLLGQTRYEENTGVSQILSEDDTQNESTFPKSYWTYYDSKGDMNIFDTFVAARMSTPKTQPYVLSWLYVPVHFVPRAIWKSKPVKGLLIDLDFMNGAPYCPGIVGFFFLDGGHFWMILCMTALGYFVSFLDFTVLTLPRTHLRFCLYGIIVINGMMLSRAFLWFYFYQILYASVPCLILAALLSKRNRKSGTRRTLARPQTVGATIP